MSDIKVGDPDPYRDEHDYNMCGSITHNGWYICTLKAGHSGDHAAAGEVIVHVWPQMVAS